MVLVQESLLRGAVLRVRHCNLEGSGGGVGRVSAALNFFVKLTRVGIFFQPFQSDGGVTTQVLFMVVGFSMVLLCVNIFCFLYSIKEE